jgi:hypothetical protein
LSRQIPGLYRIRQFFRAVRAHGASAEEIQMLQTMLNPAQMAVFRCLPSYDQRHSLEVLEALRAAGHEEPALLAAALLHDAAKTRLRLRHRALVVLARTFAPGWAERWSDGDGTGWTAPFVVAAHHADWGAEMAARADSDPLTVAIIRRHHAPCSDPPPLSGEGPGERSSFEDRLLAAFQAADDDS